MKQIVGETTKVNIPNLLTGWQTTAVFKGQWFRKSSLANKNVHLI